MSKWQLLSSPPGGGEQTWSFGVGFVRHRPNHGALESGLLQMASDLVAADAQPDMTHGFAQFHIVVRLHVWRPPTVDRHAHHARCCGERRTLSHTHGLNLYANLRDPQPEARNNLLTGIATVNM